MAVGKEHGERQSFNRALKGTGPRPGDTFGGALEYENGDHIRFGGKESLKVDKEKNIPSGVGSDEKQPAGHNSSDLYDYHHHRNPAEGLDSSGDTREGSHDAVDFKHDEDRPCFFAEGELPEKTADHSGGTREFWNDNGSHRPSEHMSMSSEKARTILRDKEVRGHPLTPKQKGLFGAIVSKGK